MATQLMNGTPGEARGKAPAAPETATSGDLFRAVQASFVDPHYLTYREVRDSTGHDAERAADALALGIYRSRGRELYGFEFKVSRSDWLRELAEPAKAESWYQYCDRWALVVSDPAIVAEGELPVHWGLAYPKKGRLKWVVKPPALHPAPLSRDALVALVYRAVQQERRDEQAAFERGKAEGLHEGERTNKLLQEQRDQLLETIHRFEHASGVTIRNYIDSADPEYAERLGKALKALLTRHPRLRDIENDLTHYANAMEREAAEVRERGAQLSALLSMADCPGLDRHWTRSIDVLEAISGEADLPVDYSI